jgi:hypothetical protein
VRTKADAARHRLALVAPALLAQRVDERMPMLWADMEADEWVKRRMDRALARAGAVPVEDHIIVSDT